MPAALDFQSISYAYRQKQSVLNGATLTLERGEVVGLLGRNGAGKTTLIRLAMGLLRPSSGSVRVFGLDPRADPVTVKKRIGFVSEEQLFPSNAEVREMLGLYRSLYPGWDESIERGLLEQFELSPRRRIGEMSKGQARQVALICAVAHRPELLILDEPAGGLDPAARRELLETSLRALQREGSTILFSSHHMADVERLGGRIVVLDAGRVRLDDQLARLRDAVCVAVVPRHRAPDPQTLVGAEGCLGVRPVEGYWHAVFRGTPEEVGAGLQGRYGSDVSCSPVDLEDLFVELLGGGR